MTRIIESSTAPNKKLRVGDSEDCNLHDGDNIDPFSRLPESIIIHILSLTPTKYAMRTCILSKEWEYRWTFIDKILVDDNECSLLGKKKTSSFIQFMYLLLCLPLKSRLDSASLTCHRKYDSFHYSQWLTIILRRKVQILEIITHHRPAYQFPTSPAYYTSLKKLKIKSTCNLKVSGKVCFKNLKMLYLGGGLQIENEQSDNDQLFFIFPVLEELILTDYSWWNVKRVEISAPSLTKFKSKSVSSIHKGFVIMIDGVKLEKFESSGISIDNFCMRAPLVYYAALANQLQYGSNSVSRNILGSRAYSILKEFPALKFLKLSNDIVQAIIESNHVLPIFNNVKELEYTYNGKAEALFELLNVLPFLESFILHMASKLNRDKDEYDYEGVESVPLCIKSQLKEVTFIEFLAVPSDLKLSKLILKNADKLEKMICYVGYIPQIPKNKIKHELSKFPRSSMSASIVVTKNIEKHRSTGWMKL